MLRVAWDASHDLLQVLSSTSRLGNAYTVSKFGFMLYPVGLMPNRKRDLGEVLVERELDTRSAGVVPR